MLKFIEGAPSWFVEDESNRVVAALHWQKGTPSEIILWAGAPHRVAEALRILADRLDRHNQEKK